MDLKDIVELSVARFHTDDTIAYLECKITEHRQKYTELFPGIVLWPKHHFVEHYPELIKLCGPLLGQWTMCFEAQLLQAGLKAYKMLQECATVISSETPANVFLLHKALFPTEA